MKKHKVLFVIESLGGGGAEKVLTTLLRYLDYDKFEVGLLSISDSGVYKSSLPSQVKYYSALSYDRQTSWWYKLKYKLIHKFLPMSVVHRWIVPKGYDTEVAFVEGFATKLVAAAPSSVRRIAWVHIDLLSFPWPLAARIYRSKEEERKAYLKFDDIIAVSDEVRDNFFVKYDIKPQTIYNPVDASEILRKSEESVKIPATENKIRLVSVGRLTNQKGFERLIDVLYLLLKDGLDCELLIIGNGELYNSLNDKIKQLNLGKYIRLLGYMENPYPVMKSSDIFVCSSFQEGFSLVVAEAMILGLPVVSTKCSGPSELLGFGDCGLLVDNSVEGLYGGLKTLIMDSDMRAQLKQKSLKRSALFSLKDVMLSVEQLLSGSKK